MPKRVFSQLADSNLRTQLAEDADRCVKCAMCQSACPTYGLARHEAESPRGRVTLISLFADDQLTDDTALDRHLDNCLLCRRCEAVCPSGVKFGNLMDNARRLTLHHRPGWLRWTTHLLSRPALVGLAIRAGRLAPDGFGKLPALARVADRGRPPAPGIYHARRAPAGRVGLFLGCVARHTHAASLWVSVKLLNHLGYDVVIPRNQVCCGALHAHMGDADRAAKLAAINTMAFDKDLEAIISAATGCGAHLQDSHHYKEFAVPHSDINAFVAKHDLERYRWRPLPARVAIHTPCSQLNVLNSAACIGENLAHIPDLDIRLLPGNDRCCGAAGSYLLTHPADAERLRAPKLGAVAQLRPDWLVTSNPGCALHFAMGTSVPIIHPVELLWRQLIIDSAEKSIAKA